MERFKNRETWLIWQGHVTRRTVKKLPPRLHHKASRKLDAVLTAENFADFQRFPPGWRFKRLHGGLSEIYQVRIDDAYRIRFRWELRTGAFDIDCGQYHEDN